MTERFFAWLNVRPGMAYSDTLPADRRAERVSAVERDLLHKAQTTGSVLASDTTIPLAGAIVAAIGTLSPFLHLHRQMRPEARRG